jgi:hypothetical protein
MKILTRTTAPGRVASPLRSDGHRFRLHGRRRAVAALTAVAAVTVSLLGATDAFAVTGVAEKNPGGLTKVGPVNSQNGFPSWYEDSAGKRVELCLDKDNPLCGFLPGDVPDETQPIAFPGNFPEEAFYALAGSTLDLPGGGRATLTLGLEAAFANAVQDGDQVTFARQRIFVRGGPADTTLTFKHPYGTITIDTDNTGAGRLTEDISPAAGNFETALKGNIGPFLTWAADAPAGYLGNPDVEHAVTGSPLGADRNKFSVTSPAGLDLETNLFTLQGKIASNSGAKADAAVLNGRFLNVFATSDATTSGALEVVGDGAVATTPMLTETGSRRFYARIDVGTGAAPAKVTVRNVGDDPVSTSVVDVTKPSGITVNEAGYNGTVLHVKATSATPEVLTLDGFKNADGSPVVLAADTGVVDVTTPAPPVTVKVTSPSGSATSPVSITGGDVTPPGLPPNDNPAPDPGPVCDPAPCAADGSVPEANVPGAKAVATPTAAIRGATVALDGSQSTNSTTFEWTQVSGSKVTFSDPKIAKPTVKVEFAAAVGDTAPRTEPTGPAVVRLTTTNAGSAPSTADVTIDVPQDTVAVTAARHRVGTELRVDGTSTIAGNTAILTPQTVVVVYSRPNATAPWTKVGISPVDTTGAWSVRPKPGPAAQQNQYLVQSSRGGTATGTLATR